MSTVINILSPHVADLIAAGEVVERPASVVKELVENSIDAGARNVTVEIKNGGMSLIRVTDDGCGMSPEDAGVAFLRHATSKLRDERGLEAISTLGFRGEALAAVSAVSRVELRTREKGASTGTRVLLTAGDIDEMGPVGAPEGTTLIVRDLFYNTPARRKFLKSDRAEGQSCVNTALKCALGHPEVSVRMLRDGDEVFFSPGDGQEKSAVYALLGRDAAAGLLECAGEADGISVRGYVSAPHACRGNRAMQFFFLNGRSFRSQQLQIALEQAYRNSLLSGRFPACVLWLTLSPGKVDVNVHPTKSEVKFSDERAVFGVVYRAVGAALEERGGRSTAEIRLSPGTEKAAQTSPRPDFFRQMTAEEYRKSGLAKREGKGEPGPLSQAPRVRSAPAGSPGGGVKAQLAGDGVPDAPIQTQFTLRSELPEYRTSPLVPRPEIPRVTELPSQREAVAAPAPVPPAGEGLVPPAYTASNASRASESVPPFRVIGEALDTYILVETGDSLLLIDKHAAHERMKFDRLKAGLGPQMSQTLLAPLSWSPGAETAELLEQNAAALEAAGFELERFGEDGVVVRAVPADLRGGELAALEEIAEQLQRGRGVDPREEILHTVACKAAIKAGSRSDPAELETIAREVVRGAVRYCPHGRPVSVRLTKTELDKQFKRIV